MIIQSKSTHLEKAGHFSNHFKASFSLQLLFSEKPASFHFH
jgi:hypothetical protein